MQVDVPSSLMDEVDALVRAGAFPSRDAAVAELLRLGLDAFRGRRERPGRPPTPPVPPVPPGHRDPPHDDRPISVDPKDPVWL